MINLFPWLREALFQCDAERAHHLALGALQRGARLPWLTQAAQQLGALPRSADRATQLGTLTVRNPVGLAAGMDKNAEYLDGLFALGFGFIEVGTATPKPQPGNPQPRLFRLPEYRAVINRMGFNNDGIQAITARVRAYRLRMQAHGLTEGVIGINLGKNATTALEQALDDYLLGIHAAHAEADYLTINISSPNTKGLRDLQQEQNLRALLTPLRETCTALDQKRQKKVPLWLKVAPDVNEEQMALMAAVLTEVGMDGLIASNTTLARDRVAYHRHAGEAGGLSGAPLTALAAQKMAQWRALLPQLPMIGVGGIMSAAEALAMKQAGAEAVQLYTGLIYEGPALLAEINRKWR